MRVLIVDDEASFRRVIKKMLNKRDFEIIEASNGNECMQRLRDQSEVDLVITDILMPEKEGIETILEIKRDFPKTKILAISGGGHYRVDYLKMAIGLGADLTLRKPFFENDLSEALLTLFGGVD